MRVTPARLIFLEANSTTFIDVSSANPLPVTTSGSAVATATPAEMIAQPKVGIHYPLGTVPGQWSVQAAEGVNTVATITRAAAVGQSHICCTIVATGIFVAVTASPMIAVLRDGTAGTGAIIWAEELLAPAGYADHVRLSGLQIVGTAGHAMTLEFTAGPGATNFQSVAMTGWTTS